MNRVIRLATVVSFAALLGACEQKGGPVKVDRVEPAEGIASGGDTVNIVGSGFQPGKTQAEVRFGRRKSEQVVISSTNKITVITPPGDKGPVDITVSFDDGAQFKIANGFRFVMPGANEDVRKAFFSGQAGEKK
jgi:hypothetical protein